MRYVRLTLVRASPQFFSQPRAYPPSPPSTPPAPTAIRTLSLHDPLPISAPAPAPVSVRTLRRSAEDTGLPSDAADIVTAAQAWHWFDLEPATAEAHRLLRPGGVLALLWNTLDAQLPWGHPYARIRHAGEDRRGRR